MSSLGGDDQIVVDRDLTDLVDHDRGADPYLLAKDMVDESGLSAAKKAGDDRDRQTGFGGFERHRLKTSGGEGVGRADRRLADPIAKRVGERVQGTPAGAVAGDDVRDRERP